MKNYISIDNKKIEISEETAQRLKEQFTKQETPSSEVAIGEYQFISDINWDEKEEILIKDKPIRKIFANQKFADNSVFGDGCVFIKCKFGNNCEFGFDCEFGSYCEFESCCKFGSHCKFGSGCEFGSHCRFGNDCKKTLPYWDENGKHE